MCGSRSCFASHSSKSRGTDRRAEAGPIVLAMAVRKARSSETGHCPTSVPYSAAGRMVFLMVATFCWYVMGNHCRRRTHCVAFRNLCVRVELVPDLSRQRCAPR